MKHVRGVAVMLLVALFGLLVGCTSKQPPDRVIPMANPHNKPGTITVHGQQCQVADVLLHQSTQDFITWKFQGSVADPHVITFATTPCDSGLNGIEIQNSNDESTACTIQKVTVPPGQTLHFKYSIKNKKTNVECADPSVDVQQ